MYLGAQDQHYTLNMFDAQTWCAREAILSRLPLPDHAARQADIAQWRDEEATVNDPFKAIDFQTAYTPDLLTQTDCPPLAVDQVAHLFKQWEHHRMERILTCRDRAYLCDH
jgi:trimethylamine monooxygenase